MENKLQEKLTLLNKNENLYGPSPECYDVIKEVSINDFIYYPRDSIGVIEKEISKMFNLPSDRIILGYGGEDILNALFSHYIFPGDKVLFSDKSWWYFKTLTEQREGIPIFYPMEIFETEYKTDVETILRFEQEQKPKLILICSPNNPTGNSIDIDQLELLLRENRERIICLDEAYWGFTANDTTEKIVEYVNKYDNLMVIRSFSKYYALAGIRIGYALCGRKVKKAVKFHKNTLGFNKISENLAIAALQSQEYYKKIARAIIEDREKIYQELNEIPGITAYKSEANFILIKVLEELKQPIDQQLKEKGILIKFFTEASFPNCARITLGTQEQNRLILETIKEEVLAVSTA